MLHRVPLLHLRKRFHGGGERAEVSCPCFQGTILINNMVKVVHSDDPSINGIIHEIDTFMIPESLKKADVIEGPVCTKIKTICNQYTCLNLSNTPSWDNSSPSPCPSLYPSLPPQLNLTDVADGNGYKTFYKLLLVSICPCEVPISFMDSENNNLKLLP